MLLVLIRTSPHQSRRPRKEIRSQCPRQYDRHCRDPKRASGMTQLLHKALLSLFNQSSQSVKASKGDTQSARSSDQLFSMQNRKDASPTNHGSIAPSSYVRNVLAQSLLLIPQGSTAHNSLLNAGFSVALTIRTSEGEKEPNALESFRKRFYVFGIKRLDRPKHCSFFSTNLLSP